MLSRIAEGLYGMGREIERAGNVIRVLEVHHKMGLGESTLSSSAGWAALASAFEVPVDEPDEGALYEHLVTGESHPFSLRRCIEGARERGRGLREQISEEMWEHLNRFTLELREVGFADILAMGRSEFNRRVESFCDAFHGLADDTMLRDDAWHFLRLGKYLERAEMVCRILEIKRKTLALAPEQEGRPIDFHQWQGMLRSLSAFEPYRRAFDAHIEPLRAVSFVLACEAFPRSLGHCVACVRASLQALGSEGAECRAVREVLASLEAELLPWRPGATALLGEPEREVKVLARQCAALSEAFELAFFRSFRPVSGDAIQSSGLLQVPQ